VLLLLGGGGDEVGVVLEGLRGGGDVGEVGLADGAAGVGDLVLRQLVAALGDERRDLGEHRGALGARQVAPAAVGERAAPGGDGEVGVGGAGGGDAGPGLLGGRVEGGLHAPVAGGARFAVDEQSEFLQRVGHRNHPLAFGLWPLAFGLWPLAFGLWPLAFGLG